MKNDNLNNEKPFSFNDLDLGVDFDLSFLDDIDESVLEKPAEEVKPAAPKAEPKKETPVKKEAAKSPAKKPAAPAPKKAASAAAEKKEAPVKKAPAKFTVPEDPDLDVLTQKAAAKKAAMQKSAAQNAQKAPSKKPATEEPVKAKKQKKGPRIGGVIFYTLYFLFILIFFVALLFGLRWLQGWLNDYEMSQPTVKAEQVFNEVFTDPDWAALYESAGAQDSPYEGKEEYVAYMEEKVGDTRLTYLETSAGLAKNTKKYIVRLGDEKVASFTLVDKNQVNTTLDLQNLENLENLTDIPNWQLGAVEVFFERVGSYRIVKLDGHTASVNGVPLTDDFTIQIATTKAEEYLPEGTTGFSMCTQEVTGLMEVPTVTITDKDGKQMPVSYDETTRTFTEQTESNTMSEEEKTVALEAAKVSSKWMIEAVTDRGEVAKYFEPSSDAYNTIVKATELWMQDYSNYRFENDEVTNYARYSDNIFSVTVKTDLIVTRTNGTEKTYSFNQSMFFQKGDSGKWLCFESTNVDVSQPVGKVRLTFMQGDTQLTTDFYNTDASEIITPVVPTPDGQEFVGWISIQTQEDGSTVYNLEFQPDETGKVSIPSGTSLRPMTLYTHFETAGASTAPAAEAAPAETAGETAGETAPAETSAETAAATEGA